MDNYKNYYQKNRSSDNLVETLKIEIKRNSVEREFENQRQVKSPVMMDTEEILNIIPAFNPSSSRGMNAEEWIDTIENIRMIYGWDDRLTLVYATLRLQEDAKRWFKLNLCDWPEFKVKLIREFSKPVDNTEYFEQLLRRRKEYNESLENYVFDVERIAKKCGCSVDSTINYIIAGLRDSTLRSKLIACNCKSVEDLFSRIQVFTDVHGNYDNQRIQIKRENSEPKEEPNTSRKMLQKCYNCGKLGHSGNECWSNKEKDLTRRVSCVKCKKRGHYARDCMSDQNIICSYCQGEGHPAGSCRFREEERNKHFPEHSSHSSNLRGDIFCGICKKTGHYAEEHSSHGSKLARIFFCGICNTSGHYAEDCQLKSVLCDHCKKKGHASKYCPFINQKLHEKTKKEQFLVQSLQDNHLKRDVPCLKCNLLGHLTKDCRNKGKFCYDCKEKGHVFKSCPFKTNIKKEREVEEKSEKKTNNMFCRNCKERGHIILKCPLGKIQKRPNDGTSGDHTQPKKVCLSEKQNDRIFYKFQLPGHLSADCKLTETAKRAPEKKYRTDSENYTRKINDLLKPAKIDDVYVKALVNLGSEYTTLQKSEFEKHDWKMQPCNLELRGFGPGSTTTIGKVSKNVRVEEVELIIDIYIVEDSVQEFPLVVGCSFLDHPSVCVIKKYRSVEIKYVDFESERAPLQQTEEQIKIKSEPSTIINEHNLLELLESIEKDCS